MTIVCTYSLFGVCENGSEHVAGRPVGAHRRVVFRQGERARRHGRKNRPFVEAVLWIARTGSPWRDLPKHFGPWHTVYMRLSRWSKQGIWARMAQTLKGDADLEQLFVDSTIVRAHQHAAGAQKKPANRRSEAAEAD